MRHVHRQAESTVSPGTTSDETCVSCGRVLRVGSTFSFRTALGEATKCFYCAIRHRPMLRRSLLTAVVVGTILTFINHGDIIFSGSWSDDLYWKVPLTTCVPFFVATWGALANGRR